MLLNLCLYVFFIITRNLYKTSDWLVKELHPFALNDWYCGKSLMLRCYMVVLSQNT